MKKQSLFCVLLLVLSMVLSTKTIANATSTQNTIVREEKISELLEQRQDIKFEIPVNSQKLDEIEKKLTALGVDFLATEEVKKRFPEAYASIETNDDISRSPSIAKPVSKVNDWSTYRVSQPYNGKNYNVQFLIAQTTNEKGSNLWDEKIRTVNYNINWEAGITNFIEATATTALGEHPILGPVYTVYDILASSLNGLRPTSEKDPCNVTYHYENSTTAAFAYVRLENYSDDEQLLCHISTKTRTVVGYLVDIDSYINTNSGAKICNPDIEPGSRILNFKSPTYANAARAAYICANYRGTESDCIQEIKISGPECESEEYIYPCTPLFPAHCE